MKYLRYFEGQEIYKSTNPVHYISKDEINDVMTEILDNFEGKKGEEKITNDRLIMSSLMKRAVIAKYKLEISDKKMDLFKKSLKQAEWRFHNFLGMNASSRLVKLYNSKSSEYLLEMTFVDCRTDEDSIYDDYY